jgi:hypothetical protein
MECAHRAKRSRASCNAGSVHSRQPAPYDWPSFSSMLVFISRYGMEMVTTKRVCDIFDDLVCKIILLLVLSSMANWRSDPAATF